MIKNLLIVKFQSWSLRDLKYLFIAIAPISTLTQSEEPVWILSMCQKELFDHLTVYKQTTDVK